MLSKIDGRCKKPNNQSTELCRFTRFEFLVAELLRVNLRKTVSRASYSNSRFYDSCFAAPPKWPDVRIQWAYWQHRSEWCNNNPGGGYQRQIAICRSAHKAKSAYDPQSPSLPPVGKTKR